MPGRTFNSTTYRYGFNGKENDNEVKGNGNSQDYGFRIYDPRLGRFLSVDPLFKEYPWYTPYQFAGNKPIWAIDRDGLEEVLVTTLTYKEIPYLRVYSYIKAENRADGHSADGSKEYAETRKESGPTWYYNSDRNGVAGGREGFTVGDIKPIDEAPEGIRGRATETQERGTAGQPFIQVAVPPSRREC